MNGAVSHGLETLVGRTGVLSCKDMDGEDGTWEFTVRAVYIRESRGDSALCLLLEIRSGHLVELAASDRDLRLDTTGTPPSAREPIPDVLLKLVESAGEARP